MKSILKNIAIVAISLVTILGVSSCKSSAESQDQYPNDSIREAFENPCDTVTDAELDSMINEFCEANGIN